MNLIGNLWINGSVSGKSLIELLNLPNFNSIKSDITDILNKNNLNINDLLKISIENIENIYCDIDKKGQIFMVNLKPYYMILIEVIGRFLKILLSILSKKRLLVILDFMHVIQY